MVPACAQALRCQFCKPYSGPEMSPLRRTCARQQADCSLLKVAMTAARAALTRDANKWPILVRALSKEICDCSDP
jgi:hypothetical protein